MTKSDQRQLGTATTLCRTDSRYLGFSLDLQSHASVVSLLTHHSPGRGKVDLSTGNTEGIRRALTLALLSAWTPADEVPHIAETVSVSFRSLAETLTEISSVGIGEEANASVFPEFESSVVNGRDETAVGRLFRSPILAFRLQNAGKRADLHSVFIIHVMNGI
jgi:hypothetical protein